MGVAGDVVRATGSGLAEGLYGLAGLPGDVMDVTRSVGTWAGNKLRKAAGKKPISGLAPDPLGLASIPGSQDMMDATGFKPYEPKTTAGEYARTVSSFVPAAATFGAGGGVRGATSAALKYGVVPGMASETAGQFTEGTAIEPWARTGAAILAGGYMGARDAMGGKRAAMDAIPGADDIKAASQALYRAAEQEGVVIHPASFTQAVDDIVLALNRAGIDRDIQPKAWAAAMRLINAQQKAVNGAAPTLEDMDIFRQIAGGVLKGGDGNEARVAGIIIDKLDDFMSGLKPSDVIAGDSQKAVGMLSEARRLWHTQAKADRVQKLFENAWDKGKKNYTQAGFETALRQEFGALNKQIRQGKVRGFTAEEKAAIQAVVDGGKMDNLMRFFGKFAPRGLLSGGGVGAVFTAAGPAVGGAYLGAAEVGKALSRDATLSRAMLVDALIRTGGKPPPELMASLPKQAMAKALVSAAPRVPYMVTQPAAQ